ALAAAAEMELAKRPTVPDVGPNNIGTTPNVIIPSVGDGVFEVFTTAAQKRYDTWLNLSPVASASTFPATASSSLPTYSNNNVGKMVDGDPASLWWSSQPPAVGSAVTIDLGAVKQVGKVLIQQAGSDTSAGDMFYHARVEYSTDNTNWTAAGTYDSKPRIEQSFDTPVAARYIRMVATAVNPGGQWVQVREFKAFEAAQRITTNLPGANGTGAQNAFDASIATAFEAAAAPVDGSHLTYTLDAPAAMKSVAVVGKLDGELQVKSDGEWVTLGALDPSRSFQEAVLDQGDVSALRIMFTPAAAARAAAAGPVVYELGLRATGPVGDGPYVGDVVEPTATPTPTESATPGPTESATPTPTESQSPEPTESETPSATPSATGSATPSVTASSSASPTATGAATMGTATAGAATTAAGNADGSLANTGFSLGAAGAIAMMLMLGGLLLARRRTSRQH
ncbi:MAG: discoidin domain-containing protein, partial [Specibacter sp.]